LSHSRIVVTRNDNKLDKAYRVYCGPLKEQRALFKRGCDAEEDDWGTTIYGSALNVNIRVIQDQLQMAIGFRCRGETLTRASQEEIETLNDCI
jgi:hypothetical protein